MVEGIPQDIALHHRCYIKMVLSMETPHLTLSAPLPSSFPPSPLEVPCEVPQY